MIESATELGMLQREPKLTTKELISAFTFWREAYCSARTRLMAASSLFRATAPISSLDRVLPSHPLLLLFCCCSCTAHDAA